MRRYAEFLNAFVSGKDVVGGKKNGTLDVVGRAGSYVLCWWGVRVF